MGSDAYYMKTDFWAETKTFQGVRNWLYDDLIDFKCESMLEVGAGKGELAHWFSEKGKYRGLEPNDKMRGDLLAEGFTVFPFKANELEAFNETFDCVYAAHLVEHLKSYEDITDFIQKARKRLNVGGRLVLLYPDIDKIGTLFYQDYTHTYPTTKKRVEDMLKDCGMKVVRSGYYAGPFTNTLIVKAVEFVFNWIPLPESWRARIQVCGYTIAQ